MNVNLTLDSKIEDLFLKEDFAKFREYCNTNNIILLKQLENIDFVIFKQSFKVTDEEKNNAKKYWERLLESASRNSLKEECSTIIEEKQISDLIKTDNYIIDTMPEKEPQQNLGSNIVCNHELLIVSLLKRFENKFLSINLGTVQEFVEHINLK